MQGGITETMTRRFLGLEPAEWAFGLLWLLANAVGWPVATGVGWAARRVVDLGRAADYAVATVAVGAVCGAAQWLVLRKRLPRSGGWVLASALGAAAGVFLAIGIVLSLFLFYDEYSWPVPLVVLAPTLAAAGGAVCGAAQWLVLRKHVRRPGWWVLASAAALPVAGGVYLALWLATGASVSVSSVVGGAAAGAASGGVYGAITGLALVLLLRHPAEERSTVSA